MIGNKRKILALSAMVLVIGVITASLVYRGSITSRITGDATKGVNQYLTEQQASNKLINYYNLALKGGVKFVRSNDLGSAYEVVLEKDKQQQVFYITKDGKYVSLLELPNWVNITLDNP